MPDRASRVGIRSDTASRCAPRRVARVSCAHPRGVPGSAALDLDDNEDDIGPVVAFVIFAGVATIALTAALLGGGEDMLPDARIPPY